MGRTRDIIQEIAEVRARRQSDSAMAELLNRLFELEHSFKEYDKSNTIGGSLWSTIYGSTATAITEQRIIELSNYVERNEVEIEILNK
jgi:hypothetical protein